MQQALTEQLYFGLALTDVRPPSREVFFPRIRIKITSYAGHGMLSSPYGTAVVAFRRVVASDGSLSPWLSRFVHRIK